jgi:hypothetical protein
MRTTDSEALFAFIIVFLLVSLLSVYFVTHRYKEIWDLLVFLLLLFRSCTL